MRGRENLKIAKLAPLAGLVAIVFTAFAPVLVGGRIFAGADQEQLLLPYATFFHAAIANGVGWLWSPDILGGFPIYASVAGGILAPWPQLALRLLPALAAYHWLVAVNALVAALATVALVRRLGGSRVAGTIAACFWLISQWRVLPDWAVMAAASILPLLLLAIETARRSRWGVTWGALVVGYGWLAVHYQWQLMTLVATGIWAAVAGWRVLRRFAGMAVVGTLLGLPWLLPAAVYQQLSSRQGGLTLAEASAHAVTPFDLGRLVVPELWLPLPMAEGFVYVGVLAVGLTLVALLGRRSLTGVPVRAIKTFGWLGLGAGLTAVAYSPLFWLLHQFPVFATVRSPARWLFIATFSAAVAAGLAFDQLRAANAPLRAWAGRVSVGAAALVGGLIIAAAAAVALTPFAFTLADERVSAWFAAAPRPLPLEHYQRTAAGMVTRIVMPFNPAGKAFWASLLTLTVAAVALRALSRGHPRAGRLAVLAAAVDLLISAAPTMPTIPKTAFVARSPTVEFLRTQPPGYTMSVLSGAAEWQQLTVPYGYDPLATHEFKRAMLTPNLGLLDNLPTWDGYENLMSRRVSRLIAELGSDRATIGETLAAAPGAPAEKTARLAARDALFDRLGVRYLVSAFPLPAPFTPLSTATVTPYAIPVRVYANADARPFAYLARTVRQLPVDETGAFTAVLAAASTTPDFMECTDCPPLPTDAQGDVQVSERTNTSLTLNVIADTPALVVVLQSALPGWRATVDGTPSPIYVVNSVAQGVAVPAGAHTVTLRYRYATVLSAAFNSLFKP